MRTLILLIFCSYSLFSQQSLPLIKANTKKALILESVDEKTTWYLSPEIKPDVHLVSKIVKPKWIRFYTDVDSIKVELKPGEKFDFIVLLNGKDSCYTRIQSAPVKHYATLKPIQHDTIPFILTEFNNIKVKAVLNGIDTLDLKFDSGTTGLLLTNDAIKQKLHLTEANKTNSHLQIGNLKWDSLFIYRVVLSGQGTDGRFGWDLFDGKIVEIDYDRRLFIVHSQLNPGKEYSKFEMQYLHSLFCIRGSLQIKNKKYENRFLFDNGYQRTVMLDTSLMTKQNYPKDLKVIKKVIMKNGQGKEIPVITVNNEKLNLGNATLTNIPVQLMTENNPAGFPIHILGNEVLKRFNTILDFQNNFVYLKPNSLINVAYSDAK